MYHSEAEANVRGFRCAARTLHAQAYPVACRFGYKAALVLSIVASVIARHA